MSQSTHSGQISGKVCLVTGANAGIGKFAAQGLAELGATVVLLCRDRVRGETAVSEIKRRTGNENLELMLCDLSSQKSIRSFANEFKARHERLDVLVNNAGVLVRQRTLSEDGIEMTFAVNHLGYFLLTNLLLDLLRKSAPSRIVNVASGAHAYGAIEFDDLENARSYTAINAYCDSKLANILFTRELARRLEGTGVTANCLHPGAVATSLFRNVPKVLEGLIKLVTISPRRGARTSIYLASSPEVEGISGRYFVKCREAKSSRASRDDAAAAKLWEISSRMSRPGDSDPGEL